MAEEELELDLDTQNNEEITRKDSRIKSLSDKVKTTSEERDALAKEKADLEAKAQAAQKEADFFKNFNSVSQRYQGSSEYQDQIREKANLGLDVEEATMLIMAKEGKYVAPAPVQERTMAAGGSASIGITDSADKSPRQMDKAELRSKLMEIESRGEKLI